MPKPARRIHRFFARHGSPVAPYSGAIVRQARRYGVSPYLMAAIIMKETEGGKTGTGRPGQYNLTGVGGVGNMHSYPGYKASIRDTARNLGRPLYKGKPLNVQTAMWVAGTGPNASTAPYTRDIKQFLGMLGANPAAATHPGQGIPGSKGRPRRPAVPGIPGVQGTTLPNPTGLFQSLGDITGVPWMIPLPDIKLPGIPGVPGKPGRPGRPGRPGAPPGGIPAKGGFALPVPTKMGASDFSYVDAEGAPDRNGVRHHAAHDWFGVEGKRTPVYSPVNGKIVEVKQATTWSGQVMGGTVKVQAPNGMVFVFRHVEPGRFKLGQRVKAGTQIARIGRWTDGSDHTHVEIWKTLSGGYRYENMIDPVAYFSRKRPRR